MGLPFDPNDSKKETFQYIINNIDERGLAIWYMDDGSKFDKLNGCRFQTEAFSLEENLLLCDMLRGRFGLEASVKDYVKKKSGKNYYYISLNKDNYIKLCDLVGKYIHSDLKYKLIEPSEDEYNWDSNYADFSVSAVDEVVTIGKFEHVFDIEVEKNHNFVACVGKSTSANESGFVVHNCQNIPPSTIKTIVSRAGQGSKLVLLGDTSQIDNPNLNKHLNGLSYAINKLKGHDNIACLQMSKSFRSRLAQQAVDIL
jgi:hypothetical protein